MRVVGVTRGWGFRIERERSERVNGIQVEERQTTAALRCHSPPTRSIETDPLEEAEMVRSLAAGRLPIQTDLSGVALKITFAVTTPTATTDSGGTIPRFTPPFRLLPIGGTLFLLFASSYSVIYSTPWSDVWLGGLLVM